MSFPRYTLYSIDPWIVYNIEVTIESSVNLCATSDPIVISIKSYNAGNKGYLYVQSNDTIYFTCSDKNASGATQPCSVYYKP